jgi:hypothetical protein
LEFFILGLAILPVLFFSFGGFTGRFRTLSIGLPFIAWLSVLGWLEVLRFLKKKLKLKSVYTVSMALAIFIFISGVIRSRDSIILKSRYRQACKFLSRQGENIKHFSSKWAITAFYLGRHNAFYPFPEDFLELKESYEKQGIKYIVVHDLDVLPEYLKEKLKEISPVKKFYNPDEYHISNLGRKRVFYLKNPEILQKKDKFIYIFKIKDIIEKSEKL